MTLLAPRTTRRFSGARITKKLQSGAEACDQDDGEHEQDGGDGVDKCECDGHGIPHWLEAATTQVNKGPTQTLFFPWPPSTNDLWRACKGRNILSARYRSWRDAATKELMI